MYHKHRQLDVVLVAPHVEGIRHVEVTTATYMVTHMGNAEGRPCT